MKLLLLRLLALVAGPFVRPTGAEIRRILVVKPDHLGDLLLASPALEALRRRYPAAQIAALVGPWSRRIWQGSPQLDALIELPFPGFNRAQDKGAGTNHSVGSSLPLRLWSLTEPYLLLLRYALLLRRGRYDAALLLRDDHWWGAALVALAGIPRRVGHAHPLSVPFLTYALPLDQSEHVTRQALAVVASLADRGPGGGEGEAAILQPPFAYGQPPMSFTPAPEERAWAEAWLATHMAPGERLVVIHPGTGGSAKHWLPERWAAVADRLAAPGTRLLLTGGPGEAPLVAEVAALMDGPSLTLAGRTSVGQLATLLGRAALVLGVDSGPLHFAASQDTPSLRLYGPSDPRRFGPWGDPARHRSLSAGIFCSPCGVFATCPRGTAGPECMAAISVESVVAAARALLENAEPPLP
jgi:ADP-heptose:LPS heptosyltransferase